MALPGFRGPLPVLPDWKALVDRHARLRVRVVEAARADALNRFFEREVWARVPADQRGRAPDKAEREGILGYGSGGV